ncbi:MAG: DNA methyltransferase [Rubrobacteraceae bacterium]
MGKIAAYEADLNGELAAAFIEAVHSRKAVNGLTHTFHRYPARFSPLFARAAIEMFTQPGEVVLDPFMGGGTTLVEACSLGRRAIGTDVSSLATFTANVKTTLLSENDLEEISHWASGLGERLNLRNPPVRATEWIAQGYQRNISGKKTWPIRKLLELALVSLEELSSEKQQHFIRCALLGTAQWALDSRKEIPTATQFRQRLLAHLATMKQGALEFSAAVQSSSSRALKVACLNRSVIGIEEEPEIADDPPKLVLTSPPYPGVHAIYHRWQVQGRKETPAPFWIANALDGQGGAFYTFGDRRQQNLTGYYEQLRAAFSSIARIADHETLLVQLVAFSDPSWQLPKYLEIMQEANFAEVGCPFPVASPDGRLWRYVPNRKWYADQRGATASSKEVVLFHRLART